MIRIRKINSKWNLQKSIDLGKQITKQFKTSERDFHRNIKKVIMNDFDYQLKGNTNADILLDRKKGRIFLQGNKDKKLIDTMKYVKDYIF